MQRGWGRVSVLHSAGAFGRKHSVLHYLALIIIFPIKSISHVTLGISTLWSVFRGKLQSGQRKEQAGLRLSGVRQAAYSASWGHWSGKVWEQMCAYSAAYTLQTSSIPESEKLVPALPFFRLSQPALMRSEKKRS